MKSLNMIISVICALVWLAMGIVDGFTPIRIFITVMWFVAAALFTFAYIKNRKNGGK